MEYIWGGFIIVLVGIILLTSTVFVDHGESIELVVYSSLVTIVMGTGFLMYLLRGAFEPTYDRGH